MKTRNLVLAALVLAIAPTVSHAQEAAIPAAEPVMLNESTVGETSALLAAVNKHRTDSGMQPLRVDPALSERAAIAFPEVVNAAGEVDVTALRRDFAATNVGILRGIVTHRRVSSGAEFPKYWAKDAQWNAMMGGDFTDMGGATVKRSDGKLVAFVYLIKR